MREIKFRGKRLDNGEWVKGYLIASRDFKRAWITYEAKSHDEDSYCWVKFEVDPETVGQIIRGER